MGDDLRLLQEDYVDDPWKILVVSMLLCRTTNIQVRYVLPALFKRWPDASSMGRANVDELRECVRSLGFSTQRSRHLIAMSRSVAEGDFEDPAELPGVGEYVRQAWALFVEDRLDFEPKDKKLRSYWERRLMVQKEE